MEDDNFNGWLVMKCYYFCAIHMAFASILVLFRVHECSIPACRSFTLVPQRHGDGNVPSDD